MTEIRDLLNRLNLLKEMTASEISLQYKNKFLGVLWAILDPILLMFTYWILISFIFNRGGEDYPALLFISILSWKWFLQSTLTSVKLYVSNSLLLQTVSFPYTVLPLSRNLLHTLNFLMGLLALIPLLIYLQIQPSWSLLWLMVLLPIQFIFNFGISMVFAVVGVYFRDLYNILSFALRLVFYLSPGLYQLVDIPKAYQGLVIAINPFASLFTSYKNVIVFGNAPSWYLINPVLIGIALVCAMFYFHSSQNRLVKDL